MSDGALLLFDAFDAAATIWRALLVWIVVGAAVATLLLLGTLAGLVWVGRRVWQAVTRGYAAPLADEQAPQAPEPLPTLHKPSTPAWALTDKEAA
ncbi:hypothetical protein [Streptomyces sp. NPDC088736]|uniref:hypothetical protein n=1 Tax=Streptomyces sp. NPDC088736 TaxID=3365881 RepID=UPI00380BA031